MMLSSPLSPELARFHILQPLDHELLQWLLFQSKQEMRYAVDEWTGLVWTWRIVVLSSRSHCLSDQLVEKEICSSTGSGYRDSILPCVLSAPTQQAARESFPRQVSGFLTCMKIAYCICASTLYPIKLPRAAASLGRRWRRGLLRVHPEACQETSIIHTMPNNPSDKQDYYKKAELGSNI